MRLLIEFTDEAEAERFWRWLAPRRNNLRRIASRDGGRIYVTDKAWGAWHAKILAMALFGEWKH